MHRVVVLSCHILTLSAYEMVLLRNYAFSALHRLLWWTPRRMRAAPSALGVGMQPVPTISPQKPVFLSLYSSLAIRCRRLQQDRQLRDLRLACESCVLFIHLAFCDVPRLHSTARTYEKQALLARSAHTPQDAATTHYRGRKARVYQGHHS
jgi:hypothetical protein